MTGSNRFVRLAAAAVLIYILAVAAFADGSGRCGTATTGDRVGMIVLVLVIADLGAVLWGRR